MKKEIAATVVGLVLGAGGSALVSPSLEDVHGAENSYYAKTGEYFEVHVYDGPTGKGYQIYYKEAGKEISKGKGPEMSERSFSKDIPTFATSTP